MPAATNKLDLLAATEKEFGKLWALIEPINEADAVRVFSDDMSLKDLIGHRAHWIALFFGWYEDGQAGMDPEIPAPGYKWNDLKAYNAKLREAQADLSWSEVCLMLKANHEQLMDLIEGLSEDALYGGPMKGGKSKWTTGRWAEAAGASHYRSASKFVRSTKKLIAKD